MNIDMLLNKKDGGNMLLIEGTAFFLYVILIACCCGLVHLVWKCSGRGRNKDIKQ